ncbi:Putative DD34D transposase [Caligus rogercresseyi]|uniref:DD34D transposase n=1 Tax=Caligus rogercresseyi TaxID=217165 RepID=A0A7T8H2K8_CALRO|nr:Putative DD34D transposase [Caligus rogercresseyi]
MGKNTVQTKAWLEKCYPDSAPSKTTIKRWFTNFKSGRTNTDDAERPGRPNEVVFPENVEKTLKIIMDNRKVKLQEIADTLKLSKGSVFTIIHEYLNMKKLFSKWVPRLLTPEQKQQRVDDSRSCLGVFTQNKKEFFRRYITMDETWIHHYTPESKRQSAEWCVDGESRPKRPKIQMSARKVMASVFWDCRGIIFIDFLEHGKTINSDYYIGLMDRLKAEIAVKRLHLKKKKVLFHQDNAPCHKSLKTTAKLIELGFELLPHPPYSPDLAPSDYWLFAELKKVLRGRKFRSDNDVIAETEEYFEGLEKSFFAGGIEKLEKRWNKCIDLKGDYIEE